MTGSKRKSKDIICTYSAIKQKYHEIATPIKCLMIFLGIFPFMVLFLELYSAFIKRIDNDTFRNIMFIVTGIMVVIMMINIIVFIRRIFYVFIIENGNNIYRLKVSNFWYKIKNQTILLNPAGTAGGRLMRMFYMIGNIKIVLDNITDTITYDELIQMGRLEKFDEIKDVKVTKKYISFFARTGSLDNAKVKNIKISRVYENDELIIAALKGVKEADISDERDMVENIFNEKSPVKKIITFSIVWTCIAAWIAIALLSNDLGKLSRINAGEYVRGTVEIKEQGKKVKTDAYVSTINSNDYFPVSEYGRLYRPVVIMYITVEFVYVFSKAIDIVICMGRGDKAE